MTKCILFCFASLLLMQAGCSKAVRYSPDEIRDYPPAVQENIKNGVVLVGMTPQQVRYAWGPPSTINILPLTENGKPKEEWIYQKTDFDLGLLMDRRLLFIDGKLMDIFPEPKPAKAQPKEQPVEQPKEQPK